MVLRNSTNCPFNAHLAAQGLALGDAWGCLSVTSGIHPESTPPSPGGPDRSLGGRAGGRLLESSLQTKKWALHEIVRHAGNSHNQGHRRDQLPYHRVIAE